MDLVLLLNLLQLVQLIREFKVTPAIMGWLDDSETEVPVAIQNNSGSTGTVHSYNSALNIES